MKTNITLKSALLFIGLFLCLYISASIYNVNQATGSFSVLNNDYTDDLNHTWNINIGTLQKVNIYYTIDTEMECDYFEIYDVDVNNNYTLLASYSGAEYGNITTTSMTGKAKVVFYTDGSVCWDSGYTGITFSFISNDNVESITKNLKVLANSYILGNNIVNGNTGLGIATPEEKLHINGNVRGNANGGALRINTESGYLDFGSMNDSWAHIYTDRPSFILNKPIWSMGGEFSAYQTSNLKLQTNGMTRMTISATNGNVGIGTTPSTTYTLDVEKDVDYQFRLGNGGGLGYNIGRSRSTGYLNFYGDQSGFNGYVFGGANGTFMSILNNGNVGIGTTTNNNKFEVVGSNSSYFEAVGFYNTYSYGNSDKAETRINIGKIENNGRQPMGAIGAFPTSNYDSNNGILVFYTRNSQNMVERLRINNNGNVSIGTTEADPTGALLTVKGTIHTKEVLIDLNTPLADYVFSPDYTLMPLHKVEAFVKTNKHLPEIPSAAEVKEKGLNMGEMQNKLLQKIEELTLYVIEQQKRIEQLEKSQK